MPLYEYMCESCGHPFERLSSIVLADEARCPGCGSSDTRRLLSLIGGLSSPTSGPVPGCACGGTCSCN